MATDPNFFPYRLDRRWGPLLKLLGVTDGDGVIIDGDAVTASFGRWHVETTLDNVDHTEITGPHRWFTAVGIRLSFADSGLTFGTNHQRGLCLAFRRPVPKVIGLRDHAALWVSVADPEGLAAAIGR